MSIREMSSQFTELLFKYRFFFTPDLFEKLHSFKHLSQDASMILDYLTRRDVLFNKRQYQDKLPALKLKADEADKLVREIEYLINNSTSTR